MISWKPPSRQAIAQAPVRPPRQRTSSTRQRGRSHARGDASAGAAAGSGVIRHLVTAAVGTARLVTLFLVTTMFVGWRHERAVAAGNRLGAGRGLF